MLPPNNSIYLLILLTQIPAFNPTANLLYVFIPIHIIQWFHIWSIFSKVVNCNLYLITCYIDVSYLFILTTCCIRDNAWLDNCQAFNDFFREICFFSSGIKNGASVFGVPSVRDMRNHRQGHAYFICFTYPKCRNEKGNVYIKYLI